jgi:hypothetical protein
MAVSDIPIRATDSIKSEGKMIYTAAYFMRRWR